MTPEEHAQAQSWLRKQKDYEYAFRLYHDFADYEFGKPRPEGTWLERMKRYEQTIWRKGDKNENHG